jgi:hypothetical protein
MPGIVERSARSPGAATAPVGVRLCARFWQPVLDAGALTAVDLSDRLCAATASADVVDASVVLTARVVDGVTVTSDAADLRRLDPGIDLVDC